MKNQGQVLIEHLIVLSLVLTPLFSLGVRHGVLEFRRAKCALLAFRSARARLIQENTAIRQTLRCGDGIEETIALAPLTRLLDSKSKHPFDSAAGEASRCWERLLPSLRFSPDSDSGSESSTSGRSPRGRSRSTGAPEPRHFD